MGSFNIDASSVELDMCEMHMEMIIGGLIMNVYAQLGPRQVVFLANSLAPILQQLFQERQVSGIQITKGLELPVVNYKKEYGIWTLHSHLHIMKVKFLSKNSILTKHSFSLNFFLAIFLVKSKLSTAKMSKTTTFSRVFHPQKMTNFSENQS